MREVQEQIDELLIDWQIAVDDGKQRTAEELCEEAGCPDLVEALQRRIAQLRKSDWMFPAQEINDDLWPDEQASQPRMLDRYEILAKIGEGGMGTVFRARHTALDREVAIKTVGQGDLSSRRLQRFRREIRTIASLNHSGIVAAYDALEVDGRWYLVMELVDGRDLHQIVQQTGPMPWEQVARIVCQCADAAAVAHDNGIVHRDIKPSNILLTRDGEPKLLDLGVSSVQADKRVDHAIEKAGSTDSLSSQLTEQNVPVGTLLFMAPEQALDAASADGRSDIYSLGCTALYLLTGRPLFGSESIVETIVQHRELDADPFIDELSIPPSAKAVLCKMLRKLPEDRFQSMRELVSAMENALSMDTPDRSVVVETTLSSSPSGRHGDSAKRSRDSNRSVLPIAVILAIAAIGGAGIWLASKFRLERESVSDLVSGESVAPTVKDLVDAPNANDYSRDIARWVLHHGGQLDVVDRSGIQTVADIGDLPGRRFAIQSVVLSDIETPIPLEIFARLSELQHLELMSCEVDFRGLSEADRFSDGMSFDLLLSLALDNCVIPENIFERLAAFPRLSDLYLAGCSMKDGGAPQLKPMPNLEMLQYVDAPIGDEQVKGLGQMPRLITLDLSGTEIGPATLEICERLPALIELDVTFTPLNDSDFRDRSFTGLERLYVGGRNLGEDFVGLVLRSPRINSLHVAGGTFSPNHLGQFSKCRKLRGLTFDQFVFTTEHIKALSEIQPLRRLDLSSCGLTTTLLQDLRLPSLRKLDVMDNSLSDEFLDALPAENLIELDVSQCGISNRAAEQFRQRYPDCELLTDSFYLEY